MKKVQTQAFPQHTFGPLFALLLAVVWPTVQQAQKLDRSFGPGGKGYYLHSMGTSGVTFFDMAIDKQGRIVVVGNTDFDPDETNNSRIVVVRLNPDGSPDPIFPAGGLIIDFPNSSDEAYAMALDASDNIIICGNTNLADGGIFKVSSSGVLDASFGSGGRAVLVQSAAFADMALSSSGKIVVLGWTAVSSSNTDMLVAQFNTNGTLDLAFGTSGYSTASYTYRQVPSAMAIQSNGKIVIVGYSITCSTNDNCNDPVIASFDASGKFDSNFGMISIPGNWESYAYNVAIQNIQGEDKILTTGSHEPQANSFNGFLERRRSNGNTETFGGSSIGFVTLPDLSGYIAIGLQADNRILLSAINIYFDNSFNIYYNTRIIRRKADGTPDLSFGTNGILDYQIGWRDTPYVIRSVGDYIYVAGGVLNTLDDTNDSDGFVIRFKDCGTGPSFTMSTTPATCNQPNGTATATVSGGSSPFTYLWNNGQMTNSAMGLASGTYTVTVTAADGCSAVGNSTVTARPMVQVNLTKTDATCNQTNGTATVNVTNNVNVVAYNWSNGGTGRTISGLSATTYTVTVTDENNCTVIRTITVSNTPTVSISTNATATTCGQNNGAASVVITGGPAQNLTYNWSNGSTTPSISNLAAGNYGVTVTDVNGCQVSATAVVNASTAPAITINATQPTCGLNNGSLTAVAQTGTTIVSWMWSSGANTAQINNLPPGTSYTIKATDNANCTTSQTMTLNPSQPLTVNLGPDRNIQPGQTATLCADGSYTSWLWSTGATTRCITVNVRGDYSVTVHDANNCTATDVVRVNEVVAVKDINDSYKITLSPNPAHETLRIALDPTTPTTNWEPLQWEIIALDGKRCNFGSWPNKQSTTDIPVGELSPGGYWLRLRGSQGVWQGRFLKH